MADPFVGKLTSSAFILVSKSDSSLECFPEPGRAGRPFLIKGKRKFPWPNLPLAIWVPLKASGYEDQ